MEEGGHPHLFGRKPGDTGRGCCYDEAEAEFLRACEQYRERQHLKFMKATDYFRVVIELGYEKPPAQSPAGTTHPAGEPGGGK
jgi:hypothetical protein